MEGKGSAVVGNAGPVGGAAEELDGRLRRLQQALQTEGIGAALIVQKTDLYYFSGTFQQGWLYVPAAGQPLLLIFRDFARARRESPLPEVVEVNGTRDIAGKLAEYGYPPVAELGMELDVLPTSHFFQYQKLFAGCTIVDIAEQIRLIRAVKSNFEIARIKAAAALSDKVAARAAELLVAGKSEILLSSELEGYARSLGHQGIVRMRLWGGELFFGHLMAGPAAAVSSYHSSPTGGEGVSGVVSQGAGFRKIGRNEPVLVDYVFALDGYLSDHTRIFSLGPVADELQAAHQAMLHIQELVKKEARPGVVSGDLYEYMLAAVAELGYGRHFMGHDRKRVRFTGHGIGLELDEYPFIAKGQRLPLAAGMIIAIEPKVVFPGRGVVGIENTHLVSDDGLVTLGTYPDQITRLP